MKKCLFLCIAWLCTLGCMAQPSTQLYVQTLKKLTDVMVNDVTGPCAAARYYAYASLAPYQVMASGSVQALPSLQGKLNSYPTFDDLQPADVQTDYAAIYAMIRMGEELLPSGYTLENAKKDWVAAFAKHYPASTVEKTLKYTDIIVKRLVQYALKDGYTKTSGYLRYTPINKPGYWQPTPPAYTEAYEPHWKTLRPFLLDSAAQFKPIRPAMYSTDKQSTFFKLAKEVYDSTRNLSKEQIHIANFWDCNPFFLNQKGHVSFGTKKISPGGHWMGITGIVCLKKKVSLKQAVQWHTLVALTMADGFISCWDEKYRSHRVRPETVINQHIDPSWRGLLQTPPFPEYTSGHSVISSAVATVLTHFVGDKFAYVDTVEEEFGIPKRSFKSFYQAAQEAGISRFYGGIHYKDSIESGMVQGRSVGRWVIEKLGQ